MNKAFIKKKKIHPFTGNLEFKLEDHIHYPLYSWPLTPVTYRVDFSGGSVRAEELVLLAGSKQTPCQLSNIVCRGDGTLLSADVTFMTDLPSGGSSIFRLEKGTPVVFEDPVTVTDLALPMVLLAKLGVPNVRLTTSPVSTPLKVAPITLASVKALYTLL